MEPLAGAVAIWLDGLPRWASSALIAATVGGLAGGLVSLLGRVVPWLKRNERVGAVVACVAAVTIVPDHIRPALDAISFEARVQRSIGELPKAVDEHTTLTSVNLVAMTLIYAYDVDKSLGDIGAEAKRLKNHAASLPSCREIVEGARSFVERIRHTYKHNQDVMEFDLTLEDCDRAAGLIDFKSIKA